MALQSYVACSVPLVKEQPPKKQLRLPHPVSALFKLGIVSRTPAGKHVVRKHSIVPAAMSKEFNARSNDACVPSIPFGEGWLQMEVGMSMVPGPEDDTGHLAGGQARPSHLACHVPHVLPVVSWHPWLSRPTCPTVVPHPSRPTLAPPLFVHHHRASPTHREPPQHGTYIPPALTPTMLMLCTPTLSIRP